MARRRLPGASPIFTRYLSLYQSKIFKFVIGLRPQHLFKPPTGLSGLERINLKATAFANPSRFSPSPCQSSASLLPLLALSRPLASTKKTS